MLNSVKANQRTEKVLSGGGKVVTAMGALSLHQLQTGDGSIPLSVMMIIAYGNGKEKVTAIDEFL